MVTLTYERDGRRRTEEFASLNDCCHSAALREAERSGHPLRIATEDGRSWSGEALRALLETTAARHGWR